jgi:4-amino-4-deoxychorismate lyase
MYQFIESIRLEEGKFGNLDYHQTRIDRAMGEFYSDSPKIDLKKFLHSCPMPSIGLHKVRIVYDNEIQSIQISHYTPREIKKLKLVPYDSISYAHKFEDRTELEKLFAQRGECDDVIIVKSNKITDASFANLVFMREGNWFTPSSYLLNGTMRQQLLDQKIIFEEEILASELSKYKKVKLINSMLLFNAPEIDVSQIVE